LQNTCPNKGTSNNNIAPLDAISNFIFDHSYYTNLKRNSWFLDSEQALVADPQTAAMVNHYSSNQFSFYNGFCCIHGEAW